MPAQPLTLPDREVIRVGIEHGETDGQIACRIGRHRATVNSELRRNGGRQLYSAVDAQARADACRARPKVAKLAADPVLAAHVTERLEAKDSPMTISIELARGTHGGYTAQVSHETIYQAVHNPGRGLARGLHVGLHRRRRCRKHRSPAGSADVKASPLGQFNLIGLRPPIAGERVEVGHLEGDLIVGAFNRSAIVTVFDRASRHLWLADLPDGHSAPATCAALIELLERIPEPLRRTLTWDQGREMADHDQLTAATGIDVFFAEPHSPWQRPTNENGNGLIRRYVGKSTNLNLYKTHDLRTIEHRINTMPRRSLDWSTAADHYAAAVAMTG